MCDAKFPLVCTETLRDLEESLFGERSLCRTFVCRYVEMWPGRFERIQDAVSTQDHDHAMDAALSLRSSSMMVGAVRLGELTTELIHLLECGWNRPVVQKLAAVRDCGDETTCQLARRYINVA